MKNRIGVKLITLVGLSVVFITLIQCNTNTVKVINSDKEIAFGPYVQKVTYKDAEVCWSTFEGVTSVTNSSGKLEEINQYRQHKTIITRLKANTKYDYDVLMDGTDNGKGSFVTMPKKAEPFRFVALGDTRTRHDVHQKIVNRIIDKEPAFVMNTGDLVGNGNSMEDWDNFFRINKELLNKTPYYTVLGNHEKDSENYYNFFSLPGNESYYFFTVGDALFVILDMEGPDHKTPIYLEGKSRDAFWQNINKEYFDMEKEWLENVLTLNKDAGYIFVFFHPTYYSINKRRVKGAELRRAYWGDIFERYDVTAVFNGHDHYYHHAINNGTHYIVTAGGGAPLYETDAIQPETVNYKKIEHFVEVEVNKSNSILNVIDIDGNEIEKISIDRRKSGEKQ